VLIGMGFNAEDAMKLVRQKRSVSDPDVWYIRNRILKFEKQWRAGK
jgi:hypothetical protein